MGLNSEGVRNELEAYLENTYDRIIDLEAFEPL